MFLKISLFSAAHVYACVYVRAQTTAQSKRFLSNHVGSLFGVDVHRQHFFAKSYHFLFL